MDERAWRAAREAQGTTFSDWPTYRDVWLKRCGKEDLGIDFALALDGGDTVDKLHTDLTYACPERLVDLDEYVEWHRTPAPVTTRRRGATSRKLSVHPAELAGR